MATEKIPLTLLEKAFNHIQDTCSLSGKLLGVPLSEILISFDSKIEMISLYERGTDKLIGYTSF